MIAIVFELMRSPSRPSCGLFGSGAPAGCAEAGLVKLKSANARKRQTQIHGRKTGLPPPLMISPRAADLRHATHTHTRYANPRLFDAEKRGVPTAPASACPRRAAGRLSFFPDVDRCDSVWRHVGVSEVFSPKLRARFVAVAEMRGAGREGAG